MGSRQFEAARSRQQSLEACPGGFRKTANAAVTVATPLFHFVQRPPGFSDPLLREGFDCQSRLRATTKQRSLPIALQ